MLLTVDIGNTNTVLGFHEKGELETHWRLTTRRDQTADEYGILFRNLFAVSGHRPEELSGVVIASVVPSLTPAMAQLSRRHLLREPLVVEPGVKTGISILYEPPGDVGADRIVNAVAAFAVHGGPVVIVDFGTATTFDVVTRKGEYVGGVICPGISISADALFQRAERLPRVEIRRPGRVIGHDTVGAIRSGLYYGYAEMVAGVLKRIRAELNESVRVVATGGLSEILAPEIKAIDVLDPTLTLTGLRLIWERNRPDEQG
ncbi:MAG: type III pantothenate kinase [Vicinamibacteria bacterium]|nr:type III pantothenate kinase [Vicinamibacteria bacterium]